MITKRIRNGEETMKNYVLNTMIELPAANETEAEELVMGLEIYDLDGNPVNEVYVEIKEIKEIG
jgi:protocatechuate 3,4-dioxygenase beta subunit